MGDEQTILAEIEAMLAGGRDVPLDRLEHTLTTGYAVALALEARRLRLERGIADAAGVLGREGDERAADIAELARDLAAADADLARLRGLLASLRDRAVAARVA